MKPLIHGRKPLGIILGPKRMRTEEFPHVCLSGVDLDSILHQAVHDGIRCGVPSEQGMLLPQRMLRAKQHRAVGVTLLHQIEKKMRFVRTHGARSPFVNNEKMVFAEAIQQPGTPSDHFPGHRHLFE